MVSTSTPELDLLFPQELIPSDVTKELPSGLIVRRFPCPGPHMSMFLQMRPLASTDYRRGHFAVLSVLTVVNDLGEDAWVAQFEAMRAMPKTYYSIVIVDQATDKIIGTGTVFAERKFIRGLGTVGHIEDIAVDKNQQGKKLGLRVIQALTHISESIGCYKTILNCNDDNVGEWTRLVRFCHG